jgi:hypothetical protein
LEEKEKKSRLKENNNDKYDEVKYVNIDECIQIRPVQGISMKGVGKYINKHKSTWNSKNLYIFYHLSLQIER